MPPLDQSVKDEEKRLRVFAYGREKCKKTWWAALCAELGFNVVLINGEPGGTQILRNISEDGRKRILVVDAVNEPDRAVFAAFMAVICNPKNTKFTWDEQDKGSVFGLRNTAHSFIQFEIGKLTLNDVVVVDSWTQLAKSTMFQYAQEHKIDLSDANKEGWDGYGFEGRFLDFVLDKITKWPCHVIVVGHSTTYEKYTPGKGDDRKLISSTVQPISSSGPHGGKVGNAFNDVLFFDRKSSEVFVINTGGSKDSVGGSRTIKPMEDRWERLTPKVWFDALNVKPTGAPCLGAVWIPPGTEQELPNAAKKLAAKEITRAVTELVQAASAPTVVQTGGLSARLRLMGKGGV